MLSETKTLSPEIFNKGLENREAQEILKLFGYDILPSTYLEKGEDIKVITNILDDVKLEINEIKEELTNSADIKLENETYVATPKSKNPREYTKENIKNFNTLNIYYHQLNKLLEYKKVSGKGINFYKSPLQLIDRLELLAGSISAGNNGVIPEFSQIAQLLSRMSVITKKDLSTLLRWVQQQQQ